jgi:SAM-dependent methyltransferase
MKTIKDVRSDARQFILPIKTLQNLPKDKKFKLLDVGGGYNNYIKDFLPENIQYHSLDIRGEHNFIHNLDKFPIPIKDNTYDIVVCLETLEHTCYPDKVMKEFLRITKKDALFLVSMPNEYNFYSKINFLFSKKTDAQEPFQVIEKHLHIHLPRVKDVLQFFSKHLKIEQVDYQWYSRTGSNQNLKARFFVFLDKIFNKFSSLNPSLFARSVIIKGRKHT